MTEMTCFYRTSFISRRSRYSSYDAHLLYGGWIYIWRSVYPCTEV